MFGIAPTTVKETLERTIQTLRHQIAEAADEIVMLEERVKYTKRQRAELLPALQSHEAALKQLTDQTLDVSTPLEEPGTQLLNTVTGEHILNAYAVRHPETPDDEPTTRSL